MKKAFFCLLAFLILSSSAAAKEPSDKKEKFPKFPKGTWLQSKPLADRDFNKKLTFVYFWDYTSINCIREVKLLKEWEALYRSYGLQMIWVHAPEFPFAGKEENLKRALQRFGVSFPVFLDNHFRLWESAKVRAWPTKILVNAKKEIVSSQAGEGGYLKTERAIRRELENLRPGTALPSAYLKKEPASYSVEKCGSMTSETYFGYKRADWWGGQIANRQYAEHDKETSFKDRGERVERGFFAQGIWMNRENDFLHARTTNEPMDYLGMVYSAQEVYTLIESKAGESPVIVTRDDEPVPEDLRGIDLKENTEGQTYFLASEPRLYYLIANEDESDHEIRLWIAAKDVAVYSFSFSNRCLSDFEHL
jgi:hypothetical protein